MFLFNLQIHIKKMYSPKRCTFFVKVLFENLEKKIKLKIEEEIVESLMSHKKN